MKIIIIGKGGHAGVVADTIQRNSIIVQSFDFIDESDGPIIGHPNQCAFIAIGDNSARERISKIPFRYFSIASKTAIVWKDGCIGSYFGHHSVVGVNSTVGDFCIINTGVILEHDSSVGNFSHLCPGVVTGGRVRIGSYTTIGLGSMIRDGITIGDNCIVGMGSVVTKNVPDNVTVYGNPARIQK